MPQEALPVRPSPNFQVRRLPGRVYPWLSGPSCIEQENGAAVATPNLDRPSQKGGACHADSIQADCGTSVESTCNAIVLQSNGAGGKLQRNLASPFLGDSLFESPARLLV